MKLTLFLSSLLAVFAESKCYPPLRVESFVNPGPSLDMVSTLIIGSESAVIIDLPLAVPQAEALASWVANTTDKPLVAAFSTHFHPDHYLSGAAFLSRFPETKYYANTKTVSLIRNEVKDKISTWKSILGNETVVDQARIPTPYDFTFFTLPGDEEYPIHLLSPLVADTIDETLFWIPSIKTLIAGDSVYSSGLHVWLADMLSPALTEAWISTLDFIEHLNPDLIVPGHALSVDRFGATRDLKHTRAYVSLFQSEVESKGVDSFSPPEIFHLFDSAFPGLLNTTSQTSATLLNITSEQFGRGGTRQIHYIDLTSYNSSSGLEDWGLRE
ncbi:hypothetical protein OPT61_g3709 [Boeremia exigua]|uniref:Uncharacterized protein n=1 Tax=Boeremia exigua TaxID=749465 RepID=A0ACC2IGY7_9PLEO|nr:hypothetical protein OPT61_g3709 [Boeremia exigua]